MRWLGLAALFLVSACAPREVGQQVGQSLYGASVRTGDAVANFSDRAGQALQNAGTNLRRSSGSAPVSGPVSGPVSAPVSGPVMDQQSYPLENGSP